MLSLREKESREQRNNEAKQKEVKERYKYVLRGKGILQSGKTKYRVQVLLAMNFSKWECIPMSKNVSILDRSIKNKRQILMDGQFSGKDESKSTLCNRCTPLTKI